MEPNGDVTTVTMARVYASQGHWEKAIEIYQHLLKKEPDRKDLAEALADLNNRMAGVAGTEGKKLEDLIPLYREWIDLLFRHDRLQKLKKLKNRL
jgi:pentatricopeptide repeat protein